MTQGIHNLKNMHIQQNMKLVKNHSVKTLRGHNQGLNQKNQTEARLQTIEYLPLEEVNQHTINHNSQMKSYVKQNNLMKFNHPKIVMRPQTSNKIQIQAGQSQQRLNKYFTLEGQLFQDNSQSEQINQEIQLLVRGQSNSTLETYSPRRIKTSQVRERKGTQAFITEEGNELGDWTQSLIFSNQTINERVNFHQNPQKSPAKNIMFSNSIKESTQQNQRRQLDLITGKVLDIKSPKTRETSLRAFFSYGRQLQQKMLKQEQAFDDPRKQQQIKFLQRFQQHSDQLKKKKLVIKDQKILIQQQQSSQQSSQQIQSLPQQESPQQQLAIQEQEQLNQIDPEQQLMLQQIYNMEYYNNGSMVPPDYSQKQFKKFMIAYSFRASRLPARLRERKNFTSEIQYDDKPSIVLLRSSKDQKSLSQSPERLTKEREQMLFKQLLEYQRSPANIYQRQEVIDSINQVKLQHQLLNSRHKTIYDYKKSNVVQSSKVVAQSPQNNNWYQQKQSQLFQSQSGFHSRQLSVKRGQNSPRNYSLKGNSISPNLFIMIQGDSKNIAVGSYISN
ncbi:UNKNOWN [Stylonychia lemnae]|uniref:Uncharacterized protein n=1 Tax=Stylonychia lemnae TaxID=5949 RepID=A0A078B5G8_STYLE|nr:UNKNOWN [Stylonychia lemnae]|eukprot:CDW89436.1 UNKNOWN [Stylonychia lemnae]